MKLVITMSRRFGTGASIIAKELSEQLNIPVYDKAYIEQKINDHMYESEAEAIRKLAEKPCIILGRCASDILKDRLNVLNIFVCADKEDRIQRLCAKHDINRQAAEKLVSQGDAQRSEFYNFYSDGIWGAAATYHLCINSSVMGIEGTTMFVAEFIEKKLGVSPVKAISED